MVNSVRFSEWMRALLQNPWVELSSRVLIGVIFIYASLHKIGNLSLFAKIIYGYALFPAPTINLIAILLPYIEIIMGAALILGIYPRSAALILAGILFMFVVAISVNLIRGHEFDCGCFSLQNSALRHSTVMLLFRDVIYFFMSIFIMGYKKKRIGCLYQTG
jgi:putative oxidoreductase